MNGVLAPETRQWLNDLIRQHDERIARRGRDYIRRVGHWRYDPAEESVTCDVSGSGDEPYRVLLRLQAADPIDCEHPPDGLDAVCTCPYSEGGRFLCKHTFAAATRLADLWDTRPLSRLSELLGSSDGQGTGFGSSVRAAAS